MKKVFSALIFRRGMNESLKKTLYYSNDESVYTAPRLSQLIWTEL